MRAVVLCDEEAALEAVAAGGGLGRKERETGYSALHHACQYGMAKLAAVLIDAGASLEAKTRDLILQNVVVQPGGQTPLHLAARGGEAEVVDLLLSLRADPTATDLDGATPAVVALQHKRRAVAARLADAASMALPSDEALATLSQKASEAGRARVAKQLEVPQHLRQAYSLEGVWSVAECNNVLAAVISAASAPAAKLAEAGNCSLADGWTTERHAAYATTDLPCSAVPAVDAWVRSSLRARVFPRLAVRHSWLPGGCIAEANAADGPVGVRAVDSQLCEAHGARLTFRDLFFVRYSAAAGCQNGLALHRDGSIISFNILLNDPASFEGGGTYIEADQRTYQIGQGDCFVHSGKLRHGGSPVTSGERYVLVAFVDVLEEDELFETAGA